ncbi:Hypothetical predicted protein [Cloeon dipterum]|uniref:Uncharacterized protein n=1 Tax=Cloeon dipterum TaxID=197152 RepID=A0A8S1DXJ4_9INSE|nr:Hypothetical predicted protein [Cloeon dipterum]
MWMFVGSVKAQSVRFIEASIRVGFFIYKNEAQINEIHGVGPYGFDLLLNWEDNLEWRLHLLEHELDLVDAFPADPLAQDEFLYFGRCKLNGVYYYGPVRSDGMIYILTPEGTMRELPEFDILKCNNLSAILCHLSTSHPWFKRHVSLNSHVLPSDERYNHIGLPTYPDVG